MKRVTWIVLTGVALTAGAVLWWQYESTKRNEKLLVEAGRALVKHRFAVAEKIAGDVLSGSPRSAPALLIAARAAIGAGRPSRGLNYLSKIPDNDSDESIDSHLLAGSTLISLGRASDAENHLRRVTSLRPDSWIAHGQLSLLLIVQGRQWEARQHSLSKLKLIASRHQARPSVEELVLLADTWGTYENSYREHFLNAVPDDPLPLIGRAREALKLNDFVGAERLVRQVIKSYPELVEPYATLGWILLHEQNDRENLDKLTAWNATPPANAREHPLVWAVRGKWASLTDQPGAAIRCYANAVNLDPNYLYAVSELARLVLTHEGNEQARPLQDRAVLLAKLQEQLGKISVFGFQYQRIPGGVAELRPVAEICESLGRLWEAWAWYRTIADADTSFDWANTANRRLEEKLDMDSPETLTAHQYFSVDFSHYPLPKLATLVSKGSPQTTVEASRSVVRFEDQAIRVGLEFRQFNGDDPTTSVMRLIESIGGGVAILDYDGDGWPDIYFTQGSHWPQRQGQQEYRDRLFRNLGGESFVDVTAATGLGDTRFSQGVAAGDFNNDGYPDLYLANVGANRLYQNNGDGTFTDIAEAAGIINQSWTSSCLIADLNGDHFADLFEVNYVGGNVLTKSCYDGNGRVIQCSPTVLPAENDRLFLNLGDNRFQDISIQAGIDGEMGKGLGILAADFAGRGRLDLFVSNDATPNFFYVNQTDRSGRTVFSEQAVTRGLGFNELGEAEACMGIAAGDADGDGLLDLFVTNFSFESNTLYRQEPAGSVFTDETNRRGLAQASLPFLGFGTQFIDGELDGWPDLIVTNGHTRKRLERGESFRMCPQYFRNRGLGKFEVVPAKQLGAFFEKRYLGRGLARIDWNRDGREDVVISHILAPVALLTNQTEPVGHWLIVKLRGTGVSRDAIGTTVRIVTGKRSFVRQLTAGDGFQASNQRQLVFGLGGYDRNLKVVVRWPNGKQQSFSDVMVDQEVMLIEGVKKIYTLNADSVNPPRSGRQLN